MRSTYLVNGLLIALIAILYGVNQYGTSQSAPTLLSNINHDQINTITITRPPLDSIILAKELADWQLIQPINASANPSRVALLLSLPSSISYAQLTELSRTRLEKLGLTANSISIKLADHSFQFGGTEPLTQRHYVLYNNTIHLIDDTVLPLLKAHVSGFIDNKLIATTKQMSKITLPDLASEQSLIITNRAGQWVTDQPGYNSDSLTTLIKAWYNAQALQVLPATNELELSQLAKVTIDYHNQDQARILYLQTDDTTFSLYDPIRKLRYQFASEQLSTLFPQ